VNTVVLICSSLTMALAVRASQLSQKKHAVIYLVLTLACAFGFLVIKYIEYSHKFHLGLLPGKYYFYDGLTTFKDPHIFFGVYFMMTGLHGIHVVAGIIAISWVLWRTVRGDFSSEYYMPVELTGLYWHLVDLIWIYLFPLLYLVG
jgi:cytochrome c oxidase subunit 3